ncbi:MAG: hypothetical protein AB9835_14555 [Eubacteriales bacterium]
MRIAAESFNEARQEKITNTRGELYLQASLIRMFVWAKNKPPTYEKVFGRLDKREMDDDELYKQVVALNKEFGGIDKRGEIIGGS